ncbi:MAG TPA: SulP family inorganic anion transporter [Planctomycetota bacterium]|nr:SulP family inorganic anion transporter [Planctomycetota bacterium]
MVAGIIVGIVALPLSIALAIAVGARPESGLYTAIVAGGLIAALGGSRTQVSGPTAAFIVILAPILTEHGELGLMVAGLMAGIMLILMGLSGLGSLIKYVPYPVTTGFTTGIAVTIATIQIKDVFGLKVTHEHITYAHKTITIEGHTGDFVEKVVRDVPGLPDHFHEKVQALYHGFLNTSSDTILHTAAIAGLTLAVLILYPHLLPSVARKIPAPLIAVLLSVAATLATAQCLGWDVETIGKRFGEIPRGLPSFNSALFSEFSWNFDTLNALLMPAIAIAMLGAIESLLSAVVADGMAGTKHDSNTELIGQGIGNVCSPLFGGIAATGAIARTATNIRNGARSPVASITHALTLLLIMVAFAPYAKYIPMAALGAILLVVSYNMAELKHFRHLLRAPTSDMIVLLTCFLLTVFTDMVIAVVVGMILAALLFMKRMSEITSVDPLSSPTSDVEMQSHAISPADIPRGVTIYSVDGPFFFGASEKAITAMETVGSSTRVVIMRLNRVPAMDATGLYALEKVFEHLQRRKVHLVISGVRAQPRQAMEKSGLLAMIKPENVAPDIEWAMVRCYEILGPEAKNRPTGSTGKIVSPARHA